MFSYHFVKLFALSYFLIFLVHFTGEKMIIVLVILFLYILVCGLSKNLTKVFLSKLQIILSNINVYIDSIFTFYFLNMAALVSIKNVISKFSVYLNSLTL